MSDDLIRRVVELFHEKGDLEDVADYLDLQPLRLDQLMRHQRYRDLSAEIEADIRRRIRDEVTEAGKVVDLPDADLHADDNAWPFSQFKVRGGNVVSRKGGKAPDDWFRIVRRDEPWRWVETDRDGGGSYWVFSSGRWVDGLCISDFYSYAVTLADAEILAKKALHQDGFEETKVIEVAGDPPSFEIVYGEHEDE